MAQYSKDTITGFSIPILKPPSPLITLSLKAAATEQVKRKKQSRTGNSHDVGLL